MNQTPKFSQNLGARAAGRRKRWPAPQQPWQRKQDAAQRQHTSSAHPQAPGPRGTHAHSQRKGTFSAGRAVPAGPAHKKKKGKAEALTGQHTRRARRGSQSRARGPRSQPRAHSPRAGEAHIRRRCPGGWSRAASSCRRRRWLGVLGQVGPHGIGSSSGQRASPDSAGAMRGRPCVLPTT